MIVCVQGYPYIIDWHATYADPTRPLLVDIGSGIDFSVEFPQFAQCFHIQAFSSPDLLFRKLRKSIVIIQN